MWNYVQLTGELLQNGKAYDALCSYDGSATQGLYYLHDVIANGIKH